VAGVAAHRKRRGGVFDRQISEGWGGVAASQSEPIRMGARPSRATRCNGVDPLWGGQPTPTWPTVIGIQSKKAYGVPWNHAKANPKKTSWHNRGKRVLGKRRNKQGKSQGGDTSTHYELGGDIKKVRNPQSKMGRRTRKNLVTKPARC